MTPLIAVSSMLVGTPTESGNLVGWAVPTESNQVILQIGHGLPLQNGDRL